MLHYFKKPVNPKKCSDEELLNDKFYRLQPFWLSTMLVGMCLGGPVIFFFIFDIFEHPFLTSDYETVKGIIMCFIVGLLIAGIGLMIIWAVSRPWRKENYYSELVSNAKLCGLYDNDYICNLSESIRRGITYKCTYLCLTDHFIIGSIYRPTSTITFLPRTNSSFNPIAVPRDCIKDIYFNLDTHKAGRTFHYDSGIEITVDNGKKIVIPYGTKGSVNRSMKAFKKTGYKIR